MPIEPFLSALARIVPSGRLLSELPLPPGCGEKGPTAFRHGPLTVAVPETQDEVVAIVRLCHRHGVPFVPRGSETSLAAGPLPADDGIVIALNRLNRIVKIHPQQQSAVVETGVIHRQIMLAAERSGLEYVQGLFRQPTGTVGGDVACNRAPARSLKYGLTASHVLGLKIVLADGEVVETGSESLEGVGVGPDLVGLFVGCNGVLGIALEITVRLVPKPERWRTMLAAYHDLQTARQAAAAVIGSGLLPAAVEVMDRSTIAAAEMAIHTGYPANAAAVLIVELDGEASQVGREFYHLQRMLDDSDAREVRTVETDDQRMAIWTGRESALLTLARVHLDQAIQHGIAASGTPGGALSPINRPSWADGRAVAGLSCVDWADADDHAIMRQICNGTDGTDGKNGRDDSAGDADVFLPSPLPDVAGANDFLQPRSVAELQEIVAGTPRLCVRGGGSKPGLLSPEGEAVCVELSGLAGILECRPDELVLTARAGTPVSQVADQLARHGLYLPFDPLLSDQGATLGGTVAANTCGSSRYRFGGVRDFLLGVRFVDGRGQLRRCGGAPLRVAAGSGLTRFFVGSLGRYGILVDVSVKVLPRPCSYLTLRFTCPSLTAALNATYRVAVEPLDIDALDIEPAGKTRFRLMVRLGGFEADLPDRAVRLEEALQPHGRPLPQQTLLAEDDTAYWRDVQRLTWVPPDASVLRVPLAPRRVPLLDARFRSTVRRYTSGGSVAWLAVDDVESARMALTELGLTGLRIWGRGGEPFVGPRHGMLLAKRVKRVLDPTDRFGPA